MKKYLIIVAALAALVSCQKDNGQKTDPTKKYEIPSEALPAPEAAAKAMAIKLLDPPAPVLKNIEITEGGRFIAYSETKLSKATPLDRDDVLTGTYGSDGDYFTLHVKGSEVKIPSKVAASELSSVLVDGKSHSASATPIKPATGKTEVGLCRTWFPVSYHATLSNKDNILFNKENSTVMNLQKDLIAYILGQEPAAKDLLFDAELQNLTFTNNNTVAVAMTGDINEACNWSKASGDQISFELNGYKVLATPYFKAGTPNQMNIIIDIKASDFDIPVDVKIPEEIINIKGRLVVTMVDAK